MRSPEVAVGRRSGLLNVADIIVSPNAAFDRLRVVPTWGWAFLVTTLLGIAGSLLIQPAVLHALDVSLPAQLAADPNITKLPAAEQQKQIANISGAIRALTQISWIFTPAAILLAGLVQALALTFAGAIGKGTGGFKTFFALSITAGVVGTGLYSLVAALIVLVRGAGTFDSTASVQGVVPGLAMLVPAAHGATAGFLSAFNVFFLWATVLLALGAIRIARMSAVAAWVGSIVPLILFALFAAYGARNG